MATGPFYATTKILLNGTACNSGASLTTEWIPAQSAIASNLWLCQTSAGTPDLTITAEYTIFHVDKTGANGAQVVKGPSITGVTTNSIASIAIGTTSTKTQWVRFNTPSELDYPYTWIRFHVAVATANATGIWMAACSNGV